MLHTEYYHQNKTITVLEWERRLASHIRAYGKEDISHILLYDNDSEIEVELSYDWTEVLEDCEIPSGARVLEIGAGFGQLTYELLQFGAEVTVVEPSLFRARVLSDRFDNRNLDIYVGVPSEMELEQRFDVIIVHDIPRGLDMRLPVQGMIEYEMSHASQWLTENGELYVLLDHDVDYLEGAPVDDGRVLPIDADREWIDQVLDVQMDLLRKLQEVCTDNGLQMYLMYGSLLGAVRHGGVIPGDDDIDVAMPREDYDKLVELAGEFQGEYFLQTPANDNAFYGGYLKLHNRQTTCLRVENWNVDPCEGIAIDIFPLDATYTDTGKEARKSKKIRLYQRMLFAYAYGYSRRFRDMPLLVWKFYKYLGKLTSQEKVLEKLHKTLLSGDPKPKNYGIYVHYPATFATRYLPAKAFAKKICIPYEDLCLDAPGDWDEVLTAVYGEWYHNPVDWEPWKQRHGFYDVEHAYPYYKEKFTRLFRGGCRDKEIVLLGDACMFDQFEKFAPWANIVSRVQIPDDAESFGLVPNDAEDYVSWVNSVDGSLDEHSQQIVIVAVNLREAEKYAKKLGSTDYVFYTYDHTDMLRAEPESLWYREEANYRNERD